MNIPEKDNLLQNSEAVFRIAAFQYNETLNNVMERDIYQCRPGDLVQSVAEEMARRRRCSFERGSRNGPGFVGVATMPTP